MSYILLVAPPQGWKWSPPTKSFPPIEPQSALFSQEASDDGFLSCAPLSGQNSMSRCLPAGMCTY